MARDFGAFFAEEAITGFRRDDECMILGSFYASLV